MWRAVSTPRNTEPVLQVTVELSAVAVPRLATPTMPTLLLTGCPK